jgi:hypothetical protein
LSSIIAVHFAARSNVINYYIPSFSHSSHGSIAISYKARTARKYQDLGIYSNYGKVALLAWE